MANIRFIDATLENIKPIMGSVKKMDDVESMRYAGLPIDEALKVCVERSYYSKLLIVNDKLIAVFGVRSANDSVLRYAGHPWMVTIDNAEGFAKAIVKYSKKAVKDMLEKFDVLVNFVSVDNEVSIRWLKWCGFKFEDRPIKINNYYFFRFKMEG